MATQQDVFSQIVRMLAQRQGGQQGAPFGGFASDQGSYGAMANAPIRNPGQQEADRFTNMMGVGQGSPDLVGPAALGGPNIPAMTGPTPKKKEEKKKGIDPAVLAAIAAQLPSYGAGIGRMIDRMGGHHAGQVKYVPAGTYR